MDEGERLNRISREIIGGAIQVHQGLGPGLLESAYEACLAYELAQRGLHVVRQKPVPLTYRQVEIECGYRLDLCVEDCVIVEVKAVERLEPIHKAQLLSYLRLSGLSLGLLINFNVQVLKDGIQRLVAGFPESRRSLRSQR